MYRNQLINQGVPDVGVVGEDVTTNICGNPDVCVLSFDTVVARGNGIAVATGAVNGTVVTITRAGLYQCTLHYPASAGGTINHVGITLNTNAAGLLNDPGMATVGIGDYASTLSPAGCNITTTLCYLATITNVLAAGAGSIIRFHAGDGANATPAVGDLTEAEVQFQVTLVSNVF